MEIDDISKEEYTKINSEKNLDENTKKYKSKKRSNILLFLFSGSMITGISIILISMSFYYCSINISFINYKLIISNLELILFLSNLISHIIISKSNPGYQNKHFMSFKSFLYKSPTKSVGDSIYLLKYCSTCELVREIRTFHCKICNRCIRRHDHHCFFISNCIGRDNIRLFFVYLSIFFIHSFYVLFNCLFFIISYFKDNQDIKSADITIILILFCLSFICAVAFIFILFLFVEQFLLISQGITKNECIRNKYNNSNFRKGFCRNWVDFCCVDDEDDDYDEFDSVELSED